MDRTVDGLRFDPDLRYHHAGCGQGTFTVSMTSVKGLSIRKLLIGALIIFKTLNTIGFCYSKFVKASISAASRSQLHA